MPINEKRTPWTVHYNLDGSAALVDAYGKAFAFCPDQQDADLVMSLFTEIEELKEELLDMERE